MELLINKYLEGTATEAEIKVVDEWYDSFEKAPGFSDTFSQKEIETFFENAYGKLKIKLD